MSLFGDLRKKIGQFSGARTNTAAGRAAANDYLKNVNEAVKALNREKFNNFAEILRSAGNFIIGDKKIHSACVAILEKALKAGNDKKALNFCEAVYAVLPQGLGQPRSGESVLRELIREASNKAEMSKNVKGALNRLREKHPEFF